MYRTYPICIARRDLLMTNFSFSTELMDFLKAVASENRLKMFLLFADGRERTVNEVTELMNLGQSTVSEQLKILRQAGLLRARKEGKEVYYSPDRTMVITKLEKLTETLKSCC